MNRVALESRALLASLVLTAALALVASTAAQAQLPAPASGTAAGADTTAGRFDWLTRRFGGQAQFFSEVYGISGMERRRPGSTWRFLATPRLGLIGGTEVGFDVVLSSEGNQARQNINQVAFEPTWGWGQLHLGDFTRDYSPYTMQGLRIRGGGLDIQRWGVRASVQGGRSAALIPSTTDGATYRRQVLAAAVGIGREGDRSLDLRIVRAEDDRIADDMPAIDTLGLDTLPADLRPQQRTRPQLNVVGALAGSMRLFQKRLAFRGELAGALLTRDLTAPAIDGDSVDGADPGATVLRTSSLGDVAWNGDLQWRGKSYGLRGGYESIGAGFTSLGLAYLVNDRRGWNVGGDTRLLRGAVALTGRLQRQENNLQSQRVATTTRDIVTGSATLRLPADLTVSLVALLAAAGNDETRDSLKVDNRSTSMTASLARPWRLAGRAASVSVAYARQSTEDRNPVRLTPAVTVQTANAALTLPVLSWLTASPSVAAVLPDGQPDGESVLGSLRLSAQGLETITLSSNFTQTFVAARRVTTGGIQFGWRLPGDVQFQVQGRMTRYGALGARPAFSEQFLTTTLGRAF